MAEITKKSLQHLADLARLELGEKESEKFSKDLAEILNHFQELQEVKTDNIQPMTGGTTLKNVLREDNIEPHYKDSGKITDAFPDKEGGYLKVPPVFK